MAKSFRLNLLCLLTVFFLQSGIDLNAFSRMPILQIQAMPDTTSNGDSPIYRPAPPKPDLNANPHGSGKFVAPGHKNGSMPAQNGRIITPNKDLLVPSSAIPAAPGTEPKHVPQADLSPTLELVIRQQLEDIRDQDLSKAYYAYTSTDFQKTFPLNVFKSFVRRSPTLLNNKTFTFEGYQFDKVIATVRGKLISVDDMASRIQYDMIQEDGAWKIRRIEITPEISTKKIIKKTS